MKKQRRRREPEASEYVVQLRVTQSSDKSVPIEAVKAERMMLEYTLDTR